MSEMSQRSKSSGTAVIITSLALLAIPLAGVILLHFGTDDGLPEIEISPMPVVLAAQARSVTDDRPGLVALEWDHQAPPLLAPSWSGIVSEVAVDPGDELRSGELVAIIDNVDRIAWHSDRPFFRSLSRGAAGDDVADLQHLLATTGYYEGEIDGQYGRNTAAAVQEWAGDLGIAKSNGDFDPGWVVWLPDERFVIAVVAITPGRPAPTPGVDILIGPTPLVGARVLTIDGESFDQGAGWIAEFEGTQLSIKDDGQIDEGTLDVLAAHLATADEEISVTIMRADPVDVVVIPATAIMTNDTGHACVWVEESGGYRAVSVAIGTATTRTVNVTGLDPDTPVLTNPGEVLERPSCP